MKNKIIKRLLKEVKRKCQTLKQEIYSVNLQEYHKFKSMSHNKFMNNQFNK
jgi:hypothetical protein